MWLLGAVSAVLVAALLGAIGVWLSGSGPGRARQASRSGIDAQAALWRHPAGRGRWPERDGTPPASEWPDPPPLRHPTGPEDDPEFISALERLIRGDHGESG